MKIKIFTTLWCFMVFFSTSLNAQTISTICGDGTNISTGDGGLATAATIRGAVYLITDVSGNIYFSENEANKVRKITVATSVITTIAGTGASSSTGDGGLATAASIDHPAGIALDASGNIYIVENWGSRIRKITVATGIITTICGNGPNSLAGSIGSSTGDGGPATAATIHAPTSLFFDTNGNLYFPEFYGARIRKIAAITGIISTICGNGSTGSTGDGGLATLATTTPVAVNIDASNNIYITEQNTQRIRKITASTGIITTICGTGVASSTGDGGLATAATINNSRGIHVDKITGDIYISEASGNKIRKITASTGIITTVCGTGVATSTGDGGLATTATINYPIGIYYSSGNIYIGDYNGKRIRLITFCPAITINPASLPAGVVSNFYSQAVTQTGLVGTPTWSISVGTLPAGLSIASGSGVISGTPTTAGSFTFTVSVTDGSCSQTKSYTIVISCPTLIFTNTTATNATVGTPYTLNAGVTGNTGTLVYSVLPALPAGLSLNTTNGTISGTPTTATVSNTYTVTATQGATCSVTQGYTFLVACTGISINPITLANGTTGTAYNQTITQTGLVGTPVWSVSVGTLPAGLSIVSGSGVISGTPTTASSSTFTVSVTDGSCSQTRIYTIVTACPTITFTNAIAYIAIINTPYTLNAGATGNTSILTYSVSPALPAGLSINTTTGLISGTPTAGTLAAVYTVMATQGICSATQTYTFAVTNCLPFTLLPATNFLPSGFVGVPYVGATISVANPLAGFTYRYFKRNAINWQTGITLNEETGVISGTPSFSTSINVVIEAVSLLSNCRSTLSTYTLVIYPDPTTSIANSLDNQVKVYPNPSNDNFNVDFGNINMTKSIVRVYDAQGKSVFSFENNTNLMIIPLGNFASGIYLLEIQTEKGRILKRLAKN